MPNFRQRKWLFIGIAIAIVVILTLVAAPNSSSSRNDSGSTYSESPSGYGAWYEYMSQKEVAIDRWRKPFNKFVEVERNNVAYIKVLSQENYLIGAAGISDTESKWVSQGNTLVILGKYEPATNAPFSSSIPYRQETLARDRIKIATTRRFQPSDKVEKILSDRYGTVVWSDKIGKGKVIYCTTPYLAANAYQENLDNYRFLADLVSNRQTVWVDEYIHGYKDRETIAQEQATLWDYLIQTPWFLLFIQAALTLAIAAIVALRRFGQPVKPRIAISDNSTAYIEALAGVLEKANSSNFVVQAIAQDERQKLQQSLGLGKSLVDRETLIDAYQQQGGSDDLRQLLQQSSTQQKIDQIQLIKWIKQWQKINNF